MSIKTYIVHLLFGSWLEKRSRKRFEEDESLNGASARLKSYPVRHMKETDDDYDMNIDYD